MHYVFMDLFDSYWVTQALIDGPCTGVPRQAIAYRNTVLTPYVLKKLTRGARSPVVKKVWEAAGVTEKWENSAWAKKIELAKKRRSTSDFDRFNVALLKKQRRRALGKAVKGAKSS